MIIKLTLVLFLLCIYLKPQLSVLGKLNADFVLRSHGAVRAQMVTEVWVQQQKNLV